MGENSEIRVVASTPVTINRRSFLFAAAVTGAGVAFGLRPFEARAGTNDPASWHTGEGTDFSAFITIAPDNTVIVRTTSPDMGNGTFIGNQMMVCEEINCDWERVKGEYLPANTDLKAGGEYSKSGALAYFAGRSTGEAVMTQVRQVAASTRERLRQAAAEKWGVSLEDITVADSMLSNAAGDSIPFAEVAEAAAGITLESEPSLKPQSEWTLLGKPDAPKRTNLGNIINGSQVFGIDVVVPGMVYAALRQVPVKGGKLVSVDKEAVLGMPGVRAVVVVDPDAQRPGLPEGMRAPFGLTASNAPAAAVAVIADHYWQAQTALDVLPVEWDLSPGEAWPDTQAVYDALTVTVREAKEPNTIRQQGDTSVAVDAPDLEAEYRTAYMDHVNMEPLNGTAIVSDDRVEAWLPSQHPQQALYLFADETGVPPENVYINQAWIGTGLGRRVYGDDTRMVAAIANQYRGTPVKVIWSREESMRQGRYRNLVGSRFRAKVDSEGMPQAVHIVTGGGNSGRSLIDSPYQSGVPNWQVDQVTFETNLMTGPWRGPVFNSHTFMIETFINEMAESAEIDAIEFRRRLLADYEDKSWIKLLDTVAEKANWGTDPGRGLAQGVAIGNWGMEANPNGGPSPFSGTTVAAIVTAEVSRRGEIYIPRVDVAIDTGSYINDRMVKAACEGGTVLSLGAALFEEINVRDGAVVEGNLDTYRVMRQNDTALPAEIHVHLDGMSGHERFSEVGEPPVGAPPPALAHAVFRLTGTWLRSKPFSKITI